jgi:hypothetical protein
MPGEYFHRIYDSKARYMGNVVDTTKYLIENSFFPI